MNETVSADGTTIAFDRTGDGPPVILVVGAFNDRSTGAPLAEALEGQLTVYNYDRRGRGASGDTQPYAIEREVEDLDALIHEAGGAASVFGYSSGANLALEAAARGLDIARLALYETPFLVDDTIPRPPKDTAAQLVAYGGESPPFMGNAAKALADTVQNGRVRALDGQSHDIVPAALAPVLLDFFAGE